METYNGKIITSSYINLNANAKTISKVNSNDTLSCENKIKEQKNFNSILNDLTLEKDIKFSKHAKTRLNDRELNLSSEQVDRLQNGMVKAKEKGLRESLVLVDNVALIVSVQNNTVITATDKKEDMIFTNIDGAIIV